MRPQHAAQGHRLGQPAVAPIDRGRAGRVDVRPQHLARDTRLALDCEDVERVSSALEARTARKDETGTSAPCAASRALRAPPGLPVARCR